MKMFSNLRNRLKKSMIKDQRGQGATEYILLLVVLVGLVVAVGPKIKSLVTDKMGDVESGFSEITTDM